MEVARNNPVGFPWIYCLSHAGFDTTQYLMAEIVSVEILDPPIEDIYYGHGILTDKYQNIDAYFTKTCVNNYDCDQDSISGCTFADLAKSRITLTKYEIGTNYHEEKKTEFYLKVMEFSLLSTEQFSQMNVDDENYILDKRRVKFVGNNSEDSIYNLSNLCNFANDSRMEMNSEYETQESNNNMENIGTINAEETGGLIIYKDDLELELLSSSEEELLEEEIEELGIRKLENPEIVLLKNLELLSSEGELVEEEIQEELGSGKLENPEVVLLRNVQLELLSSEGEVVEEEIEEELGSKGIDNNNVVQRNLNEENTTNNSKTRKELNSFEVEELNGLEASSLGELVENRNENGTKEWKGLEEDCDTSNQSSSMASQASKIYFSTRKYRNKRRLLEINDKKAYNIQRCSADNRHKTSDDTQHELSDGIQHELADNTPELADDIQHELADDIQHELADDIQHELADDIQHELADDIQHGLADDIQHELADDIQHELADDIQHELADDTAYELPDDTAPELADDTAHELADDSLKLENIVIIYKEDLQLELIEDDEEYADESSELIRSNSIIECDSETGDSFVISASDSSLYPSQKESNIFGSASFTLDSHLPDCVRTCSTVSQQDVSSTNKNHEECLKSNQAKHTLLEDWTQDSMILIQDTPTMNKSNCNQSTNLEMAVVITEKCSEDQNQKTETQSGSRKTNCEQSLDRISNVTNCARLQDSQSTAKRKKVEHLEKASCSQPAKKRKTNLSLSSTSKVNDGNDIPHSSNQIAATSSKMSDVCRKQTEQCNPKKPKTNHVAKEPKTNHASQKHKQHNESSEDLFLWCIEYLKI
ncbi:uncharacterized protein [Antedon mediterranea]|uniref:uncharacterized protein n=1 Tax=Antedon mediterranea TaxID=105859 RepID=UPI003AF81A35